MSYVLSRSYLADHITSSQNLINFLVGWPVIESKNSLSPKGSSATSASPSQGPEGYSQQIGWECAARFPKPLPYLWPKSTIFPTQFMTRDQKLTWPLHQNLFQTCVIISCLIQTNYLNIICEGLLLIFFSIMMKKWLLKNWWWKSGFLKTYSSYQG